MVVRYGRMLQPAYPPDSKFFPSSSSRLASQRLRRSFPGATLGISPHRAEDLNNHQRPGGRPDPVPPAKRSQHATSSTRLGQPRTYRPSRVEELVADARDTDPTSVVTAGDKAIHAGDLAHRTRHTSMDNDDYQSKVMKVAGGQHYRACLNRHCDDLSLATGDTSGVQGSCPATKICGHRPRHGRKFHRARGSGALHE
jgi:hypothetical protein